MKNFFKNKTHALTPDPNQQAKNFMLLINLIFIFYYNLIFNIFKKNCHFTNPNPNPKSKIYCVSGIESPNFYIKKNNKNFKNFFDIFSSNYHLIFN